MPVAAPAQSASPSVEPEWTIVDALLAEQRMLTAVERFARAHEQQQLPAAEKNYRQLLPAASPKPGQQYAFEVDLDKCSGCKACVTACHSLNGLDETETWRTVGLLISQPTSIHTQALQQHVTTACHHCADPGCANGCPVLAYDKDPGTGIVRHLDDQCIGCSYCVMKCPYEVPKYSDRLGIVRKCDMCSQRLAVGEAPACVQACPNEAIKITLVTTQPTRGDQSATIHFLPDSPDPRITLPTTRFLSAKLPADLVAADHVTPRLDPPHWPLVIMLTLTQTAAGLFLAAAIVTVGGGPIASLASIGFASLCLGLIASVLHLGQPLKAWRAFLGWRKSWLSREIIAFNAFAGAATTVLALSVIAAKGWGPDVTRFLLPATIGAAVLGLAAVFTSAMVYVDTNRPCWCGRNTFGNFFGTTLLLGATFATVVASYQGATPLMMTFAITALLVQTALFGWRQWEFHRALGDTSSLIHLNARAVRELLPRTTRTRTQLFIGATVLGSLTVANFAHLAPLWASLTALVALSSEIVGRYVFFAAGAGKRMPGGVAA